MSSRILRRSAIIVCAIGLVTIPTGCAKRTIDAGATGSVAVEGTGGSLMKFCDGTILVYWTPGITSTDEDDYEFIVYDGCTADGKIINGDNAQVQKPPRTEDLDTGPEGN